MKVAKDCHGEMRKKTERVITLTFMKVATTQTAPTVPNFSTRIMGSEWRET